MSESSNKGVAFDNANYIEFLFLDLNLIGKRGKEKKREVGQQSETS